MNGFRTSFASSSSAGPSILRSFHTTPPTLVSSKIKNARHRVHLRNQRNERIAQRNAPKPIPDYILGHVNPAPPLSSSTKSTPVPITPPTPLIEPWTNCRLSKVLIHPQTVWSLPVPDYAAGERPQYTLPGLNENEKDVLFGAVPHVTTALKYNADAPEDERDEGIRRAVDEQGKQSEMLLRIMDLRNASRARINAVNRLRVINEFGQGGWDTGGQAVQAALMTMQIRGLNEHMLSNKKDIYNRRSLRLLIQQRAKVLKYVRRTQTQGEYEQLLADIGVAREAVEGELDTRL